MPVEERPTTQYCKAPDGVSLAYQVVGNGPLDVVWTHNDAFPIDLVMDEPGFLRVAKRLARCRVLFCDGRGMGASGGNAFDRYTADITDADFTAWLDAVGFQEAALIGFSGGGPAAIRYSVRHPERVKALVLIDSFAHYVREPDYPVGLPPESFRRYLAWLSEEWGSGASFGLAPSRSGDAIFRERLARFERLGRRPEQAAELSRLAMQQDVRDLLPAISVPTLVVHRRDDPYIRVEAGRYLGSHIPSAKYVEVPGEDHYVFSGDVDAVFDEVEEFLTGEREAPEGDVITTTVLFTDIVSSTEHAAALGHRRWTQLTGDHDAMVRDILQRYRGREIKTIGDGFLATFDATTRAVRAASDIVRSASGLGLQVRAGVHLGEVEVRSDDVVGLPVSITKRICDLAGPAQTLVSEQVKALIVGSDIATSDAGQHRLKGVPDQWRLFAVES
jgi:class 3 adenylate cyclase